MSFYDILACGNNVILLHYILVSLCNFMVILEAKESNAPGSNINAKRTAERPAIHRSAAAQGRALDRTEAVGEAGSENGGSAGTGSDRRDWRWSPAAR